MDPALLERILDQVKSTPPATGVSLHLGGEPLLHPEFDTLVRLVHAYLGRRPVVATNATTLTPDTIERVVSAGGAAFETDFSSKPEVFERLRIGADWDATRGNISNALDAGLTVFLFALDGDVGGLRDLFGTFDGFKLSQTALLGGLDFGDAEIDGWTITAAEGDCAYPDADGVLCIGVIQYLMGPLPGTLDIMPPYPGTGCEVLDCEGGSNCYCVHANLGVNAPPNPGDADCSCEIGPVRDMSWGAIKRLFR